MMYKPEWKGPIEGYVVNQLPKVMWRISRTHEREDVLQEAQIVFLKCQRAYPELNEAKHFMALFKTAWTRRIHELSTKNTKVNQMGAEEILTINAIGDTDNDGFLRTLIKQAPREVRMVLDLFLNAPSELLGLAEQAFQDSNRGKAKLDQNAMVRRLLGPEVGDAPVDAVRNFFLGGK